jgi:hypothetical protein
MYTRSFVRPTHDANSVDVIPMSYETNLLKSKFPTASDSPTYSTVGFLGTSVVGLYHYSGINPL